MRRWVPFYLFNDEQMRNCLAGGSHWPSFSRSKKNMGFHDTFLVEQAFLFCFCSIFVKSLFS